MPLGAPYRVYHYTSVEAAEQIQRDGYIRPSNGLRGLAVYLTGLGPGTEKQRLVQNNQDMRPSADSRVAVYFEFDTANIADLTKAQIGGRDVWLVRNALPVNMSIHGKAIAL